MICVGQTATLIANASGGNGSFTFNWDNGACTTAVYTVNPTQTTLYNLFCSDSNGCRSQSIQVPVKVSSALSLISIKEDSICPGEVATLKAMASGGDGQYEYTWMPGNLSGGSINVSPLATSMYYVSIKDGCGSPMVSDSARVILLALPQLDFELDNYSGCKPLCLKFENKSSVAGGSISAWSWDFNNGEYSSDAEPSICFEEEGSVDLKVEAVSNYGCKTQKTYPSFVTVYPNPVAEFTYGPQNANILNPLIQFIDISEGAVKWEWAFNGKPDNKFSDLQNPTCTYEDTGTFCPQLKVTNAYGCVSEKENCLYIQPDFSFYIPNAFSPNGDGINETFTGYGTLITEYKMYIFDRWGNLVYETQEIDAPWDGKANGGAEIAQEDVYVYRVLLRDVTSKKHEYTGSVTLVK